MAQQVLETLRLAAPQSAMSQAEFEYVVDLHSVVGGLALAGGTLTTRLTHDYEQPGGAAEMEAAAKVPQTELRLPGALWSSGLLIRQCAPSSLGGVVWDCAALTAHYLQTSFPSGFWDGKRVLEVGSGTAFVSLVLAALGANVVTTDRDPLLLRLMAENVTINQGRVQTLLRTRRPDAPADHGVVVVKPFSWGSRTLALDGFDVIVGTDVVYDPDAANLLLTSLTEAIDAAKADNRELHILIGHTQRGVHEHVFFRSLRTLLEVTRLSVASILALAPEAASALLATVAPVPEGGGTTMDAEETQVADTISAMISELELSSQEGMFKAIDCLVMEPKKEASEMYIYSCVVRPRSSGTGEGGSDSATPTAAATSASIEAS